MSDALEDVENRVRTFSLAEQIHLLNFIANNINKRSSILNNQYSEEESLQKIREASLATVWETVKNDTWWYINADLRGNVFLPKNESGLSKDSVALIHQIVVVDKFRLEEKISKLPKNLLLKIEEEIDYVTKE